LSGALFHDSEKDKVNSLEREDDDGAVPVGKIILGLFLIVAGQVFTASQFVLEEWTLERYALEPLRVVGWEGAFGFLTTFVLMLVLYGAVGSTEAGRGGYFDVVEGFHQLFSHSTVWISALAIMISIGSFNFFGLSVTRNVSAMSRSTIDSCRTLLIWLVSLGLGWESFKWLQVLGFAILVWGTFMFNGLVSPPFQWCGRPKKEPLLPEEPQEHI